MIAFHDTRNVAPITSVRCPVHGSLVSRDGDGRLLGCCDACMREAALGMRRLAQMPKAAA